jgi:hypothetical protein
VRTMRQTSDKSVDESLASTDSKKALLDFFRRMCELTVYSAVFIARLTFPQSVQKFPRIL